MTGRDRYVSVLALAEIDPESEGEQVLLVYHRMFSNPPLKRGPILFERSQSATTGEKTRRPNRETRART